LTEEDPNAPKKEDDKKPWGMPELPPSEDDDIFGPSKPFIPTPKQTVPPTITTVESETFLPEDIIRQAGEDLNKRAEEYVKEEAEADKKLIDLGFGADPTRQFPKCGRGIIGAIESFMEQEYRACKEYRQIPGVLAISMATNGHVSLRMGMTLYKPAVYFLLTSAPQSGKGETLRDITKHGILLKTGTFMLPQKGSPEGLSKEAAEHPIGILINDEANSLFGGGKKDYTSDLPELLCVWYDGENPRRSTIAHGSVGSDKRIFIDVALAIAPDTLYKIVSPDTMGGGMASRFIVVFGEKLQIPNWNPDYTSTKISELKFNFVVSILMEFQKILSNDNTYIELQLTNNARAYFNRTVSNWNLRFAGDILQHYHERVNENLIRLSIIYYLNRMLSPLVEMNMTVIDSVWKRLTENTKLDFNSRAYVNLFSDELLKEYKDIVENDKTNEMVKFGYSHISRALSQTFAGLQSSMMSSYDLSYLTKPIIEDPYIIVDDIKQATTLMSISFRSDEKIKSAIGGPVIQEANQIMKWIKKNWDVNRTNPYDTPVMKVAVGEEYITVRILSKRINKDPMAAKGVLNRLSALGVLSDQPINLSKGTKNRPMMAYRVYKDSLEHEVEQL
jgi:hypothetical protein